MEAREATAEGDGSQEVNAGAIRTGAGGLRRSPGGHAVCGSTDDGGGVCSSGGCAGSPQRPAASTTTRRPRRWSPMDLEPGPGARVDA